MSSTRAAAAALKFLCFSHNNSISSSSSSSSSLPTTQLKIQTNHLTTKPNLQKIPTSSNQVKEKILCLEIMGVDSGKALTLNPSLHKASLDSIHLIISFLQSKGIQQKHMGRIFGMYPKVLTSSIENDLTPVFDFLSKELNVSNKNFGKVIKKCPRFLVSSVSDQLKPALIYLQRLGFKDLDALAYQDSILLVSNVENTLIPKLDYLVSFMGFSKEDAVGMVLRCPGLFTFSIENNLKPKFEYFVEEMEGELEELKEFPQYFGFSLDQRIKPRHQEVVESGVKVPLALMLKSTNEEFRELLKTNGAG